MKLYVADCLKNIFNSKLNECCNVVCVIIKFFNEISLSSLSAPVTSRRTRCRRSSGVRPWSSAVRSILQSGGRRHHESRCSVPPISRRHTHSSVSPCLLTTHPTVCLYSLRALLRSDKGTYKTGCSSTRTSRRHWMPLIIGTANQLRTANSAITSVCVAYVELHWSKCLVLCWITVRLSTNTFWRWRGRAIFMHKPSTTYATYRRPIWHTHWPAVWSWRDLDYCNSYTLQCASQQHPVVAACA